MLKLTRHAQFSKFFKAQTLRELNSQPTPNTNPDILYSGIFYNNDFHKSKSCKTFKTINPTNGKILKEVQRGGQQDVECAINAANDAFKLGSPWRTMDASERGRLLYKFADLLERDTDYLASLETLDNGKPFLMSCHMDVATSVKMLRFYAGFADKNYGQTIPVDGNFIAHSRHEPVGVCGQIIPWNFPMIMFAVKMGPAVVTGNTIVIKPAEQTPLTALYLANLTKEAGFPPGVVNVVPGFGDAGEFIVKSNKVDKIAFTGSSHVGLKIQQASGVGNLKRVTLELGGKSPIIICADSNLEEAVEVAHHAVFANAGQSCIAGSRTFVEEKIYDEFVARAVERAKNRKLGDPFDPTTEQGAQVSEVQMKRILEMIDSGVRDGAKLACGGKQHGSEGYYVQPTVFTDCKDEYRIAREEIFGPVQQIFKFKDIEEVIERANNTDYGLGAGVFSKDIDKVNHVVQSIRAGNVWVNCYNLVSPQGPFGGYKNSGHGRENGEYGLRQYTEVKSVITAVTQKSS